MLAGMCLATPVAVVRRAIFCASSPLTEVGCAACPCKTSWDEEARVWVATSDDVPGLATEAATLEAMLPRLEVPISELPELNDALPAEGEAGPFELVALGQASRSRHAA